ncbi:hypothetical protein C8J56DRAFT_889971 [Mycena floridula]|nr:hypothetical protein C8J56DRAFT_889971 [Mycena floridula]
MPTLLYVTEATFLRATFVASGAHSEHAPSQKGLAPSEQRDGAEEGWGGGVWSYGAGSQRDSGTLLHLSIPPRLYPPAPISRATLAHAAVAAALKTCGQEGVH